MRCSVRVSREGFWLALVRFCPTMQVLVEDGSPASVVPSMDSALEKTGDVNARGGRFGFGSPAARWMVCAAIGAVGLGLLFGGPALARYAKQSLEQQTLSSPGVDDATYLLWGFSYERVAHVLPIVS